MAETPVFSLTSGFELDGLDIGAAHNEVALLVSIIRMLIF